MARRREVPEAIRKATESAKRNLNARGAARRPHAASRYRGPSRRGRVYLARGAGGHRASCRWSEMRAVFETLGIQDVVAKSIGLIESLQHGSRDLRCAEASGFGHVRLRRAAISRCRRCVAPGRPATPSGWLIRKSRFSRVTEFKTMAKAAKTIKVRADRQRDPPPPLAARDADRPQAQQDRPHHRAEGHP